MPKPKGTPGGNPTPVQTSKFLKRKFPAAKDLPDDVELASNPLCVKLPVNLDAIVRSLPDKSVWLRAAITEKLQRDGLIPGDVQSTVEQAIATAAHPQMATPSKPTKNTPAKTPANAARYYLQLSYSNVIKGKMHWNYLYWDGSELVPKEYRHPSQNAKVYQSKSSALLAAKRLQPHVLKYAALVKQPGELLGLQPVRVTW